MNQCFSLRWDNVPDEQEALRNGTLTMIDKVNLPVLEPGPKFPNWGLTGSEPRARQVQTARLRLRHGSGKTLKSPGVRIRLNSGTDT